MQSVSLENRVGQPEIFSVLVEYGICGQRLR